jgi:hypothetical protein
MSRIGAMRSRQGTQSVLGQHGPLIASFALVSCLAVDAGTILTRTLVHGSTAAVPERPAAAPGRIVDLRVIVDAHLFGQPAVTGTNTPPTSIALVLTGVLALKDLCGGAGLRIASGRH